MTVNPMAPMHPTDAGARPDGGAHAPCRARPMPVVAPRTPRAAADAPGELVDGDEALPDRPHRPRWRRRSSLSRSTRSRRPRSPPRRWGRPHGPRWACRRHEPHGHAPQGSGQSGLSSQRDRSSRSTRSSRRSWTGCSTSPNDSKDKILFATRDRHVAAALDHQQAPGATRIASSGTRGRSGTSPCCSRNAGRGCGAWALPWSQRDARIFQYRTELNCGKEIDAKEVAQGRSVRKGGAADGQYPRSAAEPLGRAAQGGSRCPHACSRAADRWGSWASPPGRSSHGARPNRASMPDSASPGRRHPGDASEPGIRAQEGRAAQGLEVPPPLHENILNVKLDLVLDQQAARPRQQPGAADRRRRESRRSTWRAAPSAGTIWPRPPRQLGERGVSDRGVGPGRYPPAPSSAPALRAWPSHPYHRMSWMAGLLPYLGQQSVYQKIDWDKSWQDPDNWLAARTVVPQFLDPQYPEHTRCHVAAGPRRRYGGHARRRHHRRRPGRRPNIRATTRPTSPSAACSATKAARRSNEIRKGRGLSNTMVMVQIPHDGPGGVAPWIAGGGATLRGVPEKNSIAPVRPDDGQDR